MWTCIWECDFFCVSFYCFSCKFASVSLYIPSTLLRSLVFIFVHFLISVNWIVSPVVCFMAVLFGLGIIFSFIQVIIRLKHMQFIIFQLLSALYFIHSANVVHRNLVCVCIYVYVCVCVCVYVYVLIPLYLSATSSISYMHSGVFGSSLTHTHTHTHTTRRRNRISFNVFSNIWFFLKGNKHKRVKEWVNEWMKEQNGLDWIVFCCVLNFVLSETCQYSCKWKLSSQGTWASVFSICAHIKAIHICIGD